MLNVDVHDHAVQCMKLSSCCCKKQGGKRDSVRTRNEFKKKKKKKIEQNVYKIKFMQIMFSSIHSFPDRQDRKTIEHNKRLYQYHIITYNLNYILTPSPSKRSATRTNQ
jgi:hypothetical protein